MRQALRTPVGAAATAILVVLVFLAIAGPFIWGDTAEQINVDEARLGITADHPFGTDDLGRDILARVLVASRTSLVLAMVAAAIGAVGGVTLGALTVVFGRRARRFIGETINLLIAFPGLLLALLVATIVGVGTRGAVAAIGAVFIPGFARLTQTLGASVAGSDYIAAARLLGVRRGRLIVRHVLPNVAEPLILNATVTVGFALLSLSGLSFLGLGVQPPTYDWGRMMNEGLARIYLTPVAALAPGVAIVLAGLAFTLLGEVGAKIASTQPTASPNGSPRGSATKPRPRPRAGPLLESGPEPDRDPSAVVRARGLTVTFSGVSPVQDVDLDLARGEILGIVGESGSGKTLTALALAQLVPHPGVVTSSQLEYQGQELASMSPEELRRLLGTSLAMVFQDPMSTLNPALRVGTQLTEAVEVHAGVPRQEARRRAVDRLRRVRIGRPEQRIRQYPHELSGGMRQRAMLAMGLMADPALIIADEPTTSLDVTVQRRTLELLRKASEETGAAVILISHDVAVVSGLCQRVLVMYAGRVVEELDVDTLVKAPAHPYTRALVASIPDLDTDRGKPLAMIPGRPPDPGALPVGCAFAPRCLRATAKCQERPELSEQPGHASGHRAACWHPQREPLHQVATR